MSNRIIKLCEDLYPKVLVSDCTIDNISISDNIVQFSFNSRGIWVKKKENEEYCRVHDAFLKLYNCDIENVDIFYESVKEISGEIVIIKKYCDLEDVILKVNNGKWRLTIIQEYWCDIGELFICSIRDKEKSHTCYIRIDSKEKKYEYCE
ncbi:hypothetical protein SAMN05216390_1184 [Lachnospiraceae bacterium KH1T2]|nr:hypothetical protein SAMN05216390_1184 [Lachnospiraceae bacterium KH1T2]